MQAAIVPHWHRPLTQESALIPQSAQLEKAPHWPTVVPVTQRPWALQHPAQEDGSHWQVPPATAELQTSPTPHTGPPPQLQLDVAEQTFERVAGQAGQAAPPVMPQLGKAGGLWHVWPSQQPLAQLVGVQPGLAHRPVPGLQPPSALQSAQAVPLRPHSLFVAGEMQMFPEQHPEAQLVLVH